MGIPTFNDPATKIEEEKGWVKDSARYEKDQFTRGRSARFSSIQLLESSSAIKHLNH